MKKSLKEENDELFRKQIIEILAGHYRIDETEVDKDLVEELLEIVR